MTLEKQVVSLELAKRLKELGVKQESYAVWGCYQPLDEKAASKGAYLWRLSPWGTTPDDCFAFYDDKEIYAAFSVAELGLLLAEGLEGSWQGGGLIWRCKYTEVPGEKIPVTEADTEADARAKMLIYLLENKLMETDNHETV